MDQGWISHTGSINDVLCVLATGVQVLINVSIASYVTTLDYLDKM